MHPTRFSDRSFGNQAELEQYVEEQLTRATPSGWKWVRQEKPLSWEILPAEKPSLLIENYQLKVSGDWRFFILYHGNSDQGPLAMHHFALDAVVLECDALRFVELSDFLSYVLSRCHPNTWGLS